MTMQDPISDMLTRIRNAQQRNKLQVEIPYSKIKQGILAVIKEEGYIADFEVIDEGNVATKKLVVQLKYYNDKPVIEYISRVSKPSLRRYVAANEIPKVKGGLGTVIMSTPDGIVAGYQAQRLNRGGEVLVYIY